MSNERQLTDAEREALMFATQRQRATNVKKARVAGTAVAVEGGDPNIPRQDHDHNEYIRRLEASRAKDLSLLSESRHRKIDIATEEWAKIVGPTFAHASTQSPQILDRVSRMQNKRGLHKTSVVLYGDKYGRGKTWNAYAYLNSLVNLGILLPGQIFFGTESSTLARIASAGFERAGEMRDMKHPSKRAFFIDDVGQAYYFKKDHREEVWYELIDHVYTRRLTLIMTTNLEFNERGLGQWIGGRAFDRLRTLVGNDGALMLAGVNRRDHVYKENEAEYKTQLPPR